LKRWFEGHSGEERVLEASNEAQTSQVRGRTGWSASIMFTLIDVDIDHCVSFTQDLCRLQRGGRIRALVEGSGELERGATGLVGEEVSSSQAMRAEGVEVIRRREL